MPGKRFEALCQLVQPGRTMLGPQMREQTAGFFDLPANGCGAGLGPEDVDPILTPPILLDHRPEVKFGDACLTRGGLHGGDRQVALRIVRSRKSCDFRRQTLTRSAASMIGDPAGQRLKPRQRRAGVGPQGGTAEPQPLCRRECSGLLVGGRDNQADRESAVRRQLRVQPPGQSSLEGQHHPRGVLPVSQHGAGLRSRAGQHEGFAGRQRLFAQRPSRVEPDQSWRVRRGAAVGRHSVGPAAGALPVRRERGGCLERPPVGIGDPRVPVGRVAGDPAPLVDEETERVAFFDVDPQIRIDARAVLAFQFVLPHTPSVVEDRHAHAVAIAVRLVDAARDGQRPVGGRKEAADAGCPLARMLPVLADAEPLLSALEERGPVPRLLAVFQWPVSGVLFAGDAEHPLGGNQFAGKF